MQKNAVRVTAQQARFLIGQDDRGNWVVCDKKGLIGGFFTDRSSAVRFAVFESCHEAGAVYCLEHGERLPSATPLAPLKWKRSA